MRKPRDFDAELQALTDKAKAIKARKQTQLGELVAATGADVLDMETLAGALLDAANADTARKEAWRKRGAAFFHGDGVRARRRACSEPSGSEASRAGSQSPSGEAGKA